MDKWGRLNFSAGASRGNLLLHELVHAVGLGNVNNTRLVMNPYLSSRTPRGFAAGDLAGLARVGRIKGILRAGPDLTASTTRGQPRR